LLLGEENIAYLPQVRALDAGLASAAASAALAQPSLTGGSEQPTSAPVLTASSYALDYDLGSLEIDDFKDRVAYPPSQFTEETQALEQLVRQPCNLVCFLNAIVVKTCSW
jgi:hypothetical protein